MQEALVKAGKARFKFMLFFERDDMFVVTELLESYKKNAIQTRVAMKKSHQLFYFISANT